MCAGGALRVGDERDEEQGEGGPHHGAHAQGDEEEEEDEPVVAEAVGRMRGEKVDDGAEEGALVDGADGEAEDPLEVVGDERVGPAACSRRNARCCSKASAMTDASERMAVDMT